MQNSSVVDDVSGRVILIQTLPIPPADLKQLALFCAASAALPHFSCLRHIYTD